MIANYDKNGDQISLNGRIITAEELPDLYMIINRMEAENADNEAG